MPTGKATIVKTRSGKFNVLLSTQSGYAWDTSVQLGLCDTLDDALERARRWPSREIVIDASAKEG